MTAHEGAAKRADRYIDTNTAEERMYRVPLLRQAQKNKVRFLYAMCGERINSVRMMPPDDRL